MKNMKNSEIIRFQSEMVGVGEPAARPELVEGFERIISCPAYFYLARILFASHISSKLLFYYETIL